MTPDLTAAVSYERAVAVILMWEGGGVFHWDKHDSGGATKYGISLKFAGSINLDLDGDGKTTNEDIRALTRRDAVELYRKHFWLKLNCHEMPPGLALMVFDGAVNQGRHTIAKRLQRVVGATEDGIVGKDTLGAMKTWSDFYPKLIDEVAARRMRRYAQTRNFKRYGLGWCRRLMDVHSKAILPWSP